MAQPVSATKAHAHGEIRSLPSSGFARQTQEIRELAVPGIVNGASGSRVGEHIG